MNRRLVRVRLLSVSIVVAAGTWVAAQTYSRGQNISPAFEGWEQNEDGSFNFLFGYMNRNWEEEIDVPIGPENSIEPGGPDQGQPTHFLPRRNRFVFRVRVPKDWGKKELVWTLTTKGRTEKAFASLRPDYFIDDVVIASGTGSLGAGTSSPEVRANKRPQVRLDATTAAARAGERLEIVAWVTDDGVPKPRPSVTASRLAAAARARNESAAAPIHPLLRPPSRLTVNKRNGLHVSWFVYRGSGAVRFDPMQVKVWEDTRTGANSPWAPHWTPPHLPPDGRIVTYVTFESPGTYVLRARADDGALYDDQDLTVTVSK
jgi:hypothetical protein